MHKEAEKTKKEEEWNEEGRERGREGGIGGCNETGRQGGIDRQIEGGQDREGGSVEGIRKRGRKVE